MQRTKKVLWEAYVGLSRDLSLPVNDLSVLKHRLENEGLKFLTSCLPILEKALLSGLETGLFRCPTNFSRTIGLPKFLGSLFARIFDIKGAILPKPDPSAVAAIRQVCSYAYKIDIPRDIALDNQVIDKFIQTQDELKKFDIRIDPLTSVASCLIGNLFQDFDNSSLHPKYGPGSTAEVSRLSKYDRALTDLSSDFIELYGKYFSLNYEENLTIGSTPYENKESDSMKMLNRSREIPSRVVLVPKDSRGPRLICAEPSPKMFIQQGVRLQLESLLGKSALTAEHIFFKDNSENRRLANIGSLPCVSAGWATLDLKDASDRVSLALVNAIFSRVPELLRALHVLRPARFLMPDGSIVASAMHAPMGSALCFPIMSVSIWALLVSALLGFGLSLEEAVDSLYIFGDDIIIRQDYAIYAMNVLHRYGLKVNDLKSFYRGNFRESCGADFFLGVSNTPIRLKKIWWLKHVFKDVPPWYEAFEYVKHAQSLQSQGLHNTSQYWYRLAEKIIGPLPFGTEETPFLCRIVEPELVTPYNEELFDRLRLKPKVSDVFGVKTRQLIYHVYKAVPVMESKPTTGLGHFKRVHASIGNHEVITPYGLFAKHSDFKIVRRRDSLN